MKPKIPKEMMIGDELWSVRFTRNIPSKDKDLYGLCDPSDKTIYIRPGLSYRQRLDTLIHELIHALEFEHGFELEHKHVYKIAEGLVNIWLENF